MSKGVGVWQGGTGAQSTIVNGLFAFNWSACECGGNGDNAMG